MGILNNWRAWSVFGMVWLTASCPADAFQNTTPVTAGVRVPAGRRGCFVGTVGHGASSPGRLPTPG